MIKTWFSNIGTLSQFEVCRVGAASCSLWEIWVARCAATFEGTPMNARRICLKFISQVQLLSLTFTPKKPFGRIQTHLLGIIGVQAKCVRLKCGKWCQCGNGLDVLATSLILTTQRAMGISRVEELFVTSRAKLQLFSLYYYGEGTIMEAEYMALLDGLELCTAMGFQDLDITNDSQVVVTAVRNKETTSWRFIQVSRRCLTIWRDSFDIRHIFRQANLVTDRCVDRAHTHKTRRDYFSKADLPPLFGKRFAWIELESLLIVHDLYGCLFFFALPCLFGHVSLYHLSRNSFPCIGPQGF